MTLSKDEKLLLKGYQDMLKRNGILDKRVTKLEESLQHIHKSLLALNSKIEADKFSNKMLSLGLSTQMKSNERL